MRELFGRAVVRQGDMEVVGEVFEPVELLVAVRRCEADAVVLSGAGSEEPGVVSHLLSEYRHLVVLVLSPGREGADLFRPAVVREHIGGGSEAELLAALRRACTATLWNGEA